MKKLTFTREISISEKLPPSASRLSFRLLGLAQSKFSFWPPFTKLAAKMMASSIFNKLHVCDTSHCQTTRRKFPTNASNFSHFYSKGKNFGIFSFLVARVGKSQRFWKKMKKDGGSRIEFTDLISVNGNLVQFSPSGQFIAICYTNKILVREAASLDKGF